MRFPPDFEVLADDAIECLEAGDSIDEVYPLLRQLNITDQDDGFPGFEMRLDEEHQEIVLHTARPSIGQYCEARWSVWKPLSDDEDKELRTHLIRVLKSWKRRYKADQSQEPDDDEIIDTHKAKELLGTKSNTSFRRWVKDEGFDSVTQGRYRLADILAVKARREAND